MRHHALDIYGVDLYLATTPREWAGLRRRISALDKAAPTSAGMCQFLTFHPNDGGLTIPILAFWVNATQHQPEAPAHLVETCAHEASHGAAALLSHIEHSPGVDEPHAYLVGWLTQWLWEQVQ